MSSATDTAPPGEAWLGYDMTATLAPLFWGTVVSFILSGIILTQACTYFQSKDRLGIQLVAAAMLALDITSTVLCALGMYIYLIPNFGSLLPLTTFTPTLSAECYISTIIAFISQLYFARQMWIVLERASIKYALSGLVILFSIVALGGGIASSTIMITDKTHILANRSFSFSVSAGIAKGAATLSDTIATVTLCYWLGSSRTGFKATDSVLKSVMGYVIQRGILVTLIQTLFLILFFGSPSHLYWPALHVNVTRLYAMTFFAMLNNRKRIKKRLDTSCGHPSSVHLSFLESGSSFSRLPSRTDQGSNGTESRKDTVQPFMSPGMQSVQGRGIESISSSVGYL